jgi:hypothetical protein
MQNLGKQIEDKKKELLKAGLTKLPLDKSLQELHLLFNERLSTIIRPRDQSDRTSFRRIGHWIVRGCNEGKFGKEMFETVLNFAKEASGPKSRNPAAVFTALIKKELGYECLKS